MDTRDAICSECGRSWAGLSCDTLFMRLLAMDYSRNEPWGAYHSVNVACFLLQHPSRTTAQVTAGQWRLLGAFVDGGLPAVGVFARAAVQRNSHRINVHQVRVDEGRIDFSGEMRPDRFDVTIAHAALDGDFPKEWYEGRMQAWAESTRRGWLSLDKVKSDGD